MMNFLMEAVVLSFIMGGIFGAIVVMLLNSDKQREAKQALIHQNKDERPLVRHSAKAAQIRLHACGCCAAKRMPIQYYSAHSLFEC